MVCDVLPSRYFLICQIDFSSASLMYLCHVAFFDFAIALMYALSFCFHACLSSSQFVRQNIFRCLLASRRSLVISSFHHLLLCGDGLFLGVLSCVAFVIDVMSS